MTTQIPRALFNKIWRGFSYGLLLLGALSSGTLLLLAICAIWSGSRFVELIATGWVGFIFGRLFVLFIVAVVVHRLYRSFQRVTALITLLAFLGCGVFAAVKSYSPDGTYGFVGEIEPMNNAPDLAPELYHKDHYTRISKGVVYDCYGHECSRYGRYEKTAHGWTVIHEVREPFTWKLEFSVFGFRLVDMRDGGSTGFCPRRIIPIPRPYWMPDWLQ